MTEIGLPVFTCFPAYNKITVFALHKDCFLFYRNFCLFMQTLIPVFWETGIPRNL